MTKELNLVLKKLFACHVAKSDFVSESLKSS
jgi:hypothetical protein